MKTCQARTRNLAYNKYNEFINIHIDSNILLLQLGVSRNTLGIIKYPFWKMVFNSEKIIYACINLGEVICPENINDKSICIDSNIKIMLDYITKLKLR